MLKSIEIVCFNALLAAADLCRLCRDVYPEKLGWAEAWFANLLIFS